MGLSLLPARKGRRLNALCPVEPVDFVALERRPTLLHPTLKHPPNSEKKNRTVYIHQKKIETYYHAEEQARDGATTICSAGLEN